MDKTEHLASLVINAAQVFIEKRMAPIVEGLAALKRDAGAFMTRDAATKLLLDTDEAARRMTEMSDEIKSLREELAARPTLEMVRAEQANVASKAAAELFATLRIPEDGKSVTVDEVRPLLEQMVAAIPVPKNGKDAEPVDLEAMVKTVLAAIPVPKDGKDADPVDYQRVGEQVDASIALAMRMIQDPKDGKDAEVDYDRIGKAIEEVVAALPAPKDGAAGNDGRNGIDGKDGVNGERGADGVNGQDGADGLNGQDGARGKDGVDGSAGIDGKDGSNGVDGKDGAAGINGKDGSNGIDGKDGADGIHGKDGAPGKDADFALVKDMVTMSLDSAMAKVRVPEDGKPGKDADPVDMDAVDGLIADHVVRTLATWPRPADGKDGLGFDDLSLDLKEDGRTIVHRYARGDQVKIHEIVVPWQIYRGLFQSGKRYSKGDTVTYAGSQFIAIRDTEAVPPKSPDWQLAVKSGKDKEA